MEHSSKLLLELFLMFAGGKLLAELFERMRQPAVTGEIAAGVGVVPRGEVGLIVAAVGLSLHIISDAFYAVVLLMSVITTLVAPPTLR